MPLGGYSEEKGVYTGRDPPRGISSMSHRLDVLILGSYTGGDEPYWLVGGLLKLIEGLLEAQTLLMRSIHMNAYP